MAYMSQEKKKEIAANLKQVMPAGWKYTLGVHHHSTIVLTISEAPVDLVGEYVKRCAEQDRNENRSPYLNEKTTHVQVNPYWTDKYFADKRAEQMKKIIAALNDGNHDRSDTQT